MIATIATLRSRYGLRRNLRHTRDPEVGATLILAMFWHRAGAVLEYQRAMLAEMMDA